MKNPLGNFFISIILGLIFQTQFSFAQGALAFKPDSVPVKVNGANLLNPWAGGINYPQISNIDLDFDGVKDFFIFDRVGSSSSIGGKIITFLNNKIPGSTKHLHAPQYEDKFPALHDWALLVDYNCDNKEDIFTYNNGSFSIYKNTSNSTDGLNFTLEKEKLYSSYNPNDPSNPNYYPLYVSSVDIPAITDVDNDGDIDVLTFSLTGSYVEFHKNFSKELYGHCDSLVFKLADQCWGKFIESASTNSIVLDQSCPQMPTAPDDDNPILNTLHAGSCLLCLDLDGDIDRDLLLGDVSFNNITMVKNGGTLTDAYAVDQDPAFPSYNVPVNIPIYPCGYSLDVDNDSLNDLLFAPTAPNVSENLKSFWFYKNTGTDTLPVYELIKTNIFQEDMIDVGEGAKPVFFDYNNDGKTDLLISNHAVYQVNNVFRSGITAFKNIGTAQTPSFELETADYANLSADFNFQSIAPTFGDLDGDGDMDMIIGTLDGTIHYFKNSAGAGNPSVFTLTTANFGSIDVGQFSSPQLFDLDKDGKLDLIIGERSGNLNYYRNTGSVTAPSFTLVTNSLGGVNVTLSGFTAGYSQPFFLNDNGSTKLFVGSERGYIFSYSNIDNNLSASFTLNDSITGGINKGIRSTITGADINNDGTIEFIVGNYRGGVSFYESSALIGINENDTKAVEFKLYPNPANNLVNCIISATDAEDAEIKLYDVLGQNILVKKVSSSHITLDTGNLKSGIYFLELNTRSSGSVTRKLVVKK